MKRNWSSFQRNSHFDSKCYMHVMDILACVCVHQPLAYECMHVCVYIVYIYLLGLPAVMSLLYTHSKENRSDLHSEIKRKENIKKSHLWIEAKIEIKTNKHKRLFNWNIIQKISNLYAGCSPFVRGNSNWSRIVEVRFSFIFIVIFTISKSDQVNKYWSKKVGASYLIWKWVIVAKSAQIFRQ